MQRLEVSGAVRPIYGSLGVKRLILWCQQHRSSRNVHVLDRIKVRPFVSNFIKSVQEIWKLLLEINLPSEFDIQMTVHRDIFLK